MANNTLLNPEIIAEKGDQIYREKLANILEKDHKGEFVAIDVETGKYFLGKTLEDALQNAEKEFPEKIFHLIRIGYTGIFEVSWSTKNKKNYGWIF